MIIGFVGDLWIGAFESSNSKINKIISKSQNKLSNSFLILKIILSKLFYIANKEKNNDLNVFNVNNKGTVLLTPIVFSK